MMNETDEKPHIVAFHSQKLEVNPGIYAWCSCGFSASQPFCDGSHKGTSFKPYKLKVEEHRKISWCLCKHTQKPPFCDGSHKTLPGYEPPAPKIG